MTRMAQQSGYILLPVMLAITLVAAVAFSMNYESASETNAVSSELESDQARYLAEAGLNHARWQLEQAGCGPFSDIAGQAFGSHSYSATITPNNAGGTITTYSVPVIADAMIKSDTPTQNYGTDAQLSTYFNFIPSSTQRTLYRFDIESSGIPVGAMVVSAVAKVFVVDSNDTASVTAHQITEDWTEASVNWDNINTSHDSTTLASIPSGSPVGEYALVNITSLVQGWVNGSTANQGVMLKTTSIGDLAQFTSKEYGNIDQHPLLEVKITDGSLSNRADISVQGTLANGVSRSVAQKNLVLYQATPNTLELQPDATKGKDTFLDQWFSTRTYGSDTLLSVRAVSAFNALRPMLSFDLSAIPVGASVQKATLSLYLEQSSTDPITIDIHRIASAWEEDTATWNERSTGTPWSTAGGDFPPNPVAGTTIVPIVGQFYEWDITALANDWISEAYANHGFIMVVPTGSLQNGFASSDSATAANRPKLTITYTCECGVACLAPQGSGKVLLVVDDAVNVDPDDVYKRSLFESWGYKVALIDDDGNQAAFDAVLGNNDVAYISETVVDGTLGDKLAATTKGVVNEEGGQSDNLAIASASTNSVGRNLSIHDNSHYITELLSLGALPIYSADMDGLSVSGTLAPGLQTLADWGGQGGLAFLDVGAEVYQGGNYSGDGTATGRRVSLPIGRDGTSNFNWRYLNNNGRLIVQRAIQWGADGIGACTDGNLRDEFTAEDFSGNAGSLTWSGDWFEVDSAGIGANQGKLLITAGELRLQGTPSTSVDPETGATIHDPSLTREADLSAYQSATLDFDFRTGAGVDVAEDSAVVEVSGDGGASWTVLEDFINAGPGASGSRSYNITPYIAADTQVRFRINTAYGGSDEYFYVDNVDVAAGCDPPPSFTPFAHWKLDEVSGTTAVDSVGGHDGTLTNGPVWVTGQIDGALRFDGSNDYINVPHDDTLSLTETMTFVAWVNVPLFGPSYKVIINKDAGGADSNFWFGTWRQELEFGFYSGGAFYSVYTTGLSLQTGIWYQLAASFDNASDQVRLYVNGTEVHTGTLTQSPSAVSADVVIGWSPDGEYWRGLLDDVRIYDSVFPASEIADLYTAGGGGGVEPGVIDSSCNGTFRDEFNTRVYAGNNGTLPWAGDWQEVGETDGPTRGDVRVDTDQSDYQLRIRDNDNGGEGVERVADLSGATTAFLSFDYRRVDLDENINDYVAVYVSSNGTIGPWTELARIGTSNDGSYQSYSKDISDYISTNTAIRLLSSPYLDREDSVWFDNIQIQCKSLEAIPVEL